MYSRNLRLPKPVVCKIFPFEPQNTENQKTDAETVYPLHSAILEGKNEIIETLIENGADHSKIEEKDWDELFSRKWNKFVSDQDLKEVKLALNKNNSRGSIPENSDDKDADLRVVENTVVETENSATKNFRDSVLKHYDNNKKESDDDSSHNKSTDTTLPLGSIAAVAVGVGVGVIACALNSGLKPKKGEEKTNKR